MARLSQDEYDYVLGELKKQGISDEQARAMMTAEGYEAPTLWDKTKDVGAAALDYGLRGLDYTSGLGRGAAGGIAEMFTDKDLVRIEDVLKGQAPTTSQMMETAGWDEAHNPYYSRDILGFVGDVALDPLTYATMGASAAAKAGMKGTAKAITKADQLLNFGDMLGRGVKNTGQKLFASGVKRLDNAAIAKGENIVSPYLLKRGNWGTLESIYDGMEKASKELAETRKGLYRQADNLGAKIDPAQAFAPAQRYLDDLVRTNPEMAPKAAPLRELLDVHIAPDPQALAQAKANYARDVARYGVDKERYLDAAKQYRADLANYRRAGGTTEQMVLPFSDVGQRTAMGEVQIPLRSEGAQMAAPGIDMMNAEQRGLLKSTVVPRDGQITFDDYLKNMDYQAQPPKVHRAEQLEALGTDLVPQQYGQAQLPFVEFAGPDQLSIALPPTRPVRPAAPVMADVPNQMYDFQRASDIKTQLYDALPASAYDGQSNAMSSTAKEFNKARAAGLRSEIINQGNAAQAGLGDAIDEVNAEWGAYLSANPRLAREIQKEANKDLITQTKSAGAVFSPWAAAAAYGAQILNATPVRTGAGVLLDRAGDMAPQTAWKQLLLAPTDRGDEARKKKGKK